MAAFRESVSMKSEQDFIDLRIRAEFLDLCGDLEAADRLRRQSLESAREVDLTCYAYQLLWRGRVDDAIKLLRWTADEHPCSWNVFQSLGDAYMQRGELAPAVVSYLQAANLTPDPDQRQRIQESVDVLIRLKAAALPDIASPVGVPAR